MQTETIGVWLLLLLLLPRVIAALSSCTAKHLFGLTSSAGNMLTVMITRLREVGQSFVTHVTEQMLSLMVQWTVSTVGEEWCEMCGVCAPGLLKPAVV